MTTEALYSVTGKIRGTLVTVRGDSAEALAGNLAALLSTAGGHVLGFTEWCEDASKAPVRVGPAPTTQQAVGLVQQTIGAQVIEQTPPPAQPQAPQVPQQFPNAGTDPNQPGPHGPQYCEHTNQAMLWKTGNRKRDNARYEGYFCAANAQKCSRHYKCPA